MNSVIAHKTNVGYIKKLFNPVMFSTRSRFQYHISINYVVWCYVVQHWLCWLKHNTTITIAWPFFINYTDSISCFEKYLPHIIIVINIQAWKTIFQCSMCTQFKPRGIFCYIIRNLEISKFIHHWMNEVCSSWSQNKSRNISYPFWI